MKIVKSADVAWAAALTQGKFANRRKGLSPEGAKISAGLWELPPGKRSFPLHSHHVTEEAMFVISGHAKVRTPDGESAIGPGDYVSFLPGGPAHQLLNDGNEPLVYLGLSTNPVNADIVEYPESKKVSSAIGAQGPNRKRFIFESKDQVDYMKGEE